MYWFSRLNTHFGATAPTRYLRSVSWLIFARMVSMTVSLAATFYIARALGPQNFGELSYAQSIVGILSLFSAAVGSLYRDLVRFKDRETTLLGTAWVVSVAASLVTSLLAIGYVLLMPHDTLTIMVVGLLCIAQFFSPFAIIQNVFYAKTETKWLAFANLFVHMLVSAAKIAAMISGQGVLVLASIMILEQMATATLYVLMYTYLHHRSILRWNFDLAYARQLITDSLPLIVITGSGMISGRIDQVFIKHYLDTATVGFYSVAVQLSEVWQLLPTIIISSILPAIINAHSAKYLYRRRLAWLSAALLLYAVCGAALLTLLAPLIIGLIYGGQFAGSVALLQIYCWSIPGMVLGLLINNFLLVENFRRIQMAVGILPMLINVGLNLIFIPVWGAPGAALATVISFTLAPLLPFAYRSVRRAIAN